MKLRQAREAARRWTVEQASRIPQLFGVYSAGSTNWLPDDSELSVGSDLDLMVVVSDENQAGTRGKFIYRDTLLEVSYLASHQFQSPQQILVDYHLAPSFRTTKVIFDPRGYLSPLLAAVSQDYAKPQWIRQRCASARDRVLTCLQSIKRQAPLHDQVMACLFAAGITTHVLLVAGLRNPTVRARYVAVRELLADYGRLEFQDILLQLLGSARINQERALKHLATLTEIFDATTRVVTTRFPFVSDLTDIARPGAIDASRDMIGRGGHREAMFWLAVTYSRCRKVLAEDTPGDLTERFKDSYQEMVGDLGLSTFNEIHRRGCDIERLLPRVSEVAEDMIQRNRAVEED